MFTMEIRINGTMIAHIYGRNTGETKDGAHEYVYELYETETRGVVNGTVYHKRQEGIKKLVSAILADADK